MKEKFEVSQQRGSLSPALATIIPFSILNLVLLCCTAAAAPAPRLGIFEGQADIGPVQRAGSIKFEPARNTYEISGGGDNMWFTNDAFHYVWQRLSGDFLLQAAVAWLGTNGNPHRKACLMVRQSLAPDSAYVDVAVHGNGLLSLQFREHPGDMTHEIQARQPAGAADAKRTTRVGLERQGHTFFLTVPGPNGSTVAHGAFMQMNLADPVYVGLGVCAHDAQGLETARFADVHLERKSLNPDVKPHLHCALETVAINSKDRRVRYHTTEHIEAPNWSRDGKYFLLNSGGHMYRLAVTGNTPELIDTGFASRCNNDHGLSPDGTRLAISDQSQDGKSRIYVLPASGGTPRKVTVLGPSYWHGWSPDGLTLAYCGERDGEFDVYTVGVDGGEEKRLTTAKGLDDGPDFSPDGRFIYFNSDRTGTMQIWRMRPDGTEQEQLTHDELNNWFPHPSPDGKWLVFLSYEHEVKGHPANQRVQLRLMALSGSTQNNVQDLASLFGGQGTINVPSWSPDSRELAFVSYALIHD